MSVRSDAVPEMIGANRERVLRTETNEQQSRQLVEWNDTARAFPKARCIHKLFSEQAARTPKRLAVGLDNDFLTYRELDRRGNQLAHYLRSMGVGPETVVGICSDRSLDLIVGLLGILKAGGAYLPLDISSPKERTHFVLKDADVSLVLVSQALEAAFAGAGIRTIRLDSAFPGTTAGHTAVAPRSGATADNLAYIMYTSGSVGTPKGVGVVNYNISRLVKNTNYVQITPDDVFLQLAPLTFDASTFEIWGALLNGARLILYPPTPVIDLNTLKSVIHRARITTLWLTAGLFNRIVDIDLSLLSPIKQLLVGGDVVSARHVRHALGVLQGCRIINGYGPTECTTFSTCFPIPDLSSAAKTVPIGRPISNSTAYVLDSDLKPVPIGQKGELYIGGLGVGRGYHKRPDLTAESFIPNPFSSIGTRLYKTGDIVRYSQDGQLEFIGRNDFQMKVRGFRIESEEVEAALLLNQNIRSAVVLAAPDGCGDKRLVVYVVPACHCAPTLKDIRDHLRHHVPEYMLPSALVLLDDLPLTSNGKIDRKALLLPEPHVDSAAPPNNIEEAIVDIWRSILGAKDVGLDDEFFDLGGTSLELINVVVEMGKRFGIPLDASIVAGGATVAALSRAVRTCPAMRCGRLYPEETITEIWKSTLGINELSRNDDFFELGGTSLALINVVVEMTRLFDVPLDTSIITGGATVSSLAERVRERLAISASRPPSEEETITEIWKSVLDVREVGLSDDFFDLGGTSLSMINVVVEMSKRFDLALDTDIVANGATIGALSQAVRDVRRKSFAPQAECVVA